MDQPTHVIDPDGEVMMILHNANAPFAEWDEDMVSQTLFDASKDVQTHGEANEVSAPLVEQPMASSSNKERKKKKKKSGARSMAQPILEPVEHVMEAPVDESVGEHYKDPFGGLFDEPVDERIQKTGDEDSIEHHLRIQVSAKHLTVASPFFKKALSGAWKERVTFLRKGPVEITAESWDIDAFLILLQIMHCQFSQIPRKLTLEMLAKVAVIADYYECKEVVRFFSDMWIAALDENIPKAYCRTLVLWLWVAWAFQLRDQLREITSIAMSHSNGWINNLGLPIPGKVIDSMNSCRQIAIQVVVDLVKEIHEGFLKGSRGCSFECRSIMYGALTQGMKSNGLLSPEHVQPFPSVVYTQFVQKVRSFKSPQWHGSSSNYEGYSSGYRHSCQDSSFASLFGGLKGSIEGLDLLKHISG